jgi:hypothetical protein
MNDTTYISGNSDRSVIFVHGRNFKPAPGEYMDILNSALSAGIECDKSESLYSLAAVNKYLAYYGDLTNELLSGHDQFFDEQLDVSDLRSALHALKDIDRKKGFGVGKYDKLPGKSAVTEFAASVLAPVLSAVGLEKPLVASATKDLGAYWEKNSEFGAAVLDRVRKTIATALERNEHIMLVSHGTGSIVTFDALWQLSHDPAYSDKFPDSKIDCWLTLGSPLGDSMVRKQLAGADRKGRERFPTNVLAWHNVSAEDDYVCHDSTVADDFKAMLKQRQIGGIRDYRIYNLAIRYGCSNPHSIIGYLIHPRVSKIVSDWLTQSFGMKLPKDIF